MTDVFNRGDGINPKHTGLYIVDRGEKLGTPYRWFDVETGDWGRCEYILQDAMDSRGQKGALGWLPWRGPVKVAVPKPVAEVQLVAAPVEVAPATVKPAKVAKAPKPVKVAKPKVAKAPKAGKVTYADGTIVFRADRQKYMAWYGGFAEAARPTIEAAKAFLSKKYGVTEFTIVQ
jgi:hypothetical protein